MTSNNGGQTGRMLNGRAADDDASFTKNGVECLAATKMMSFSLRASVQDKIREE